MTVQELVEYECVCAAEAEAEVAFWREKRLAAQIVSMMGESDYMAAVELADVVEGREDDEWHARGGW